MGYHGKQILPGTLPIDRLATTGYVPSAANDLTNVAYVQALFAGLDPKGEAKVRAVGNVNILTPPSTIDGVTMVDNYRVVLGNQTNPAENGLWVWHVGGLVRATDFNTGNVKVGAFVYVQSGTQWGGFGFFVSGTPASPPNINVGVDPIIFDVLSRQSAYVAVNGIDLTGNVFSLGGNLSNDVNFNGGGVNGFNFANLSEFEVSTDAYRVVVDKGGSIFRVENAAANQEYLDIKPNWRINFGVNSGSGAGVVNADYSTNFGDNGQIDAEYVFNAAKDASFDASAIGAFASGTKHTIGNGTTGSGAGSFSTGIDTQNFGEGSITSGVGSRIQYTANQRGGIAHGFSVGTGAMPAVPYVTAASGAVNISRNTVAQTNGNGALAQDSVILGGYDHHIPANSPGSVILGGQGIIARSVDPNQVYVPNFNIASVPATGIGTDTILVRDPVTGQIKQIAQDSIEATIGDGSGTTGASGGANLGGILTVDALITGAFNFTIQSNSVVLDAIDGLESTSLSILQNSMVFRGDTAGFLGVRYFADYSANFSNRSLVDKEYVDSLIGGGGLANTTTDFTSLTDFGTASKGRIRFDTTSPSQSLGDVYLYYGPLSFTGHEAYVGLVDDGNGNGSYNMAVANYATSAVSFMSTIVNGDVATTEINSNRSDLSAGTKLIQTAGNGGVNTTIESGSGDFARLIVEIDLVSANSRAELNYNSDTFIRVNYDGLRVGLSGVTTMEYSANYSANYTNRSFVDKEYVDNLVSAGGVSSGNGITIASNQANLGGIVTANINIAPDGAGLYQFHIGDTIAFNDFLVNAGASNNLLGRLELQSAYSKIEFEDVLNSYKSTFNADPNGTILRFNNSGTDYSVGLQNDGRFLVGNYSDTSAISGWEINSIVAGQGVIRFDDGTFNYNVTTFQQGTTSFSLIDNTSTEKNTSANFAVDGSSFYTNSLDASTDNLFLSSSVTFSATVIAMTLQQYSDVLPETYAGLYMDVVGVNLSLYEQTTTGFGGFVGVDGDMYTPYAKYYNNLDGTIATAFRIKREASGVGAGNPNVVGTGARLDYELLIGISDPVVSGAIDNISTIVGANWESKFEFHVGDNGALTPVLSIDKTGAYYNTDYSSLYSNRSLVDKGYVDGLIGFGAWPLQGNATLTNDVTISGDSIYNLSLSDLLTFQVVTTGFSAVVSGGSNGFQFTNASGTGGFNINHNAGGEFNVTTSAASSAFYLGHNGTDAMTIQNSGSGEMVIRNNSTTGGRMYIYNIGLDGFKIENGSGDFILEASGGLMSIVNYGGGGLSIISNDGGININNASGSGVINMESVTDVIVSLGSGGRFAYFADYSADFTLRSLVDVEYVTNALADVSLSAPSSADKDLICSITAGDESDTGLTISNPPTGILIVALNGEIVSVGDGTKTKKCYFSGDSGVSARSYADIVGGDKLYWNGIISGYDLDADDRIDIYYI